jgi:hypothetical protein
VTRKSIHHFLRGQCIVGGGRGGEAVSPACGWTATEIGELYNEQIHRRITCRKGKNPLGGGGVGWWPSLNAWVEHKATSIKSYIFWDITPCSPLKVNRRFGGTCRLQQSFLPSSLWFLAWFILQSWRWRRHVPPKRLLTFNGLHAVVSQQI